MKKALCLAIMLGILLVGVASAVATTQTIVVGKVYIESYSKDNFVPGALVEIECGGVSKSNVTLSDGTYGFSFDGSVCGDGSTLKIKASKDTKFANLNEVISSSSTGDIYAVANVLLDSEVQAPIVVSSGGGSSSTVSWNCGEWSECVDGNQSRVCQERRNREPNRTEVRECVVPVVLTSTEQPTTEEQSPVEEIEEEESGFLAGLTGAVIGFAGTGTGIGLVFALVILIAGAGVMVSIRRKRLKKA
jgi:hypothetical protein